MSTATDWGPGTWTDTGEHALVTDVTSATTDTDPAPALTVDDMHALMQQNERLARENAAMRAQLGGWTPQRQHDPLTSPDRPPREIRGVADLTEQERHTALVAPTPGELAAVDDDGMPQTPMAAQYEWTTWLGDLHHADARLAEAVAETRSWAASHTWQTTVWDDDLRALCEPIETDWWRREDRLMVGLVTRGQDAGVYGELAPDRIAQDSLAPERASGRGGGAETPQSPLNGSDDQQPSPPGALVPTGAPERHDPPQREPKPEPDDRVQRMTDRVTRRDTLASAVRDTSGDVTIADYADAMEAAEASRVGGDEPTSKSRRSRLGAWLRRRAEWVAVAGVITVWTAVMSWAAWEVLA